jgi:hypothetical protein
LNSIHCCRIKPYACARRTLHKQIEERALPPFCAADIFVGDRGLSVRTCLSYAVIQLSITGSSEFSRRPSRNRNISDKKTKTKSSAEGSPSFGYFSWRSKKSD